MEQSIASRPGALSSHAKTWPLCRRRGVVASGDPGRGGMACDDKLHKKQAKSGVLLQLDRGKRSP